MKILSALPAILLLVSSAASAGVMNTVSINGRHLTQTEPTVVEKGKVMTTTTKVLSAGITNASILDAMVQLGLLSNKTGYTLIELRSDEGEPFGFYAYNTKTGATVEAPISTGEIRSVTAQTSVTRQTGSDIFETTTNATETGITTVTYFGTPLSAFYEGKSSTGKSPFRSDGVTYNILYQKPSYTATARGATANAGIIDAKVTSNFRAYVGE